MRSGHSVPCRYSSRAARDTKHWPQAKTNYNGLHSPRNAFCALTSPSYEGWHRARTRYRRRRCGPRSVLLTMRINSCLISFALSREVPASLLGKLGQRATASRRFEVVWSEEGCKGKTRAKTKKKQRGTKVRTIRASGISILIESTSFRRLFSSAEQRMCIYIDVCSLQKLTGLSSSSY